VAARRHPCSPLIHHGLTTDSSKVKHQAGQHKMRTQMPIAEIPIAVIFVMCQVRLDGIVPGDA
jgi:hypothetical protein